MGLTPLTMMVPDDAIIAFQALPVGFVSGAMIQVALQQASQEFASLRLEELLNLAMVELLCLGRTHMRDQRSERLEGARELFPCVERRVYGLYLMRRQKVLKWTIVHHRPQSMGIMLRHLVDGHMGNQIGR
jgi:hypothetical protein